MSEHDKGKPRSGSSADDRSHITPPVFFPAVIGVPNEQFKFTDIQIAQLEEAGKVAFLAKQRTDLLTLAEFWIHDLQLRLSARPKHFRTHLNKIIKALSRAEEACRLNERVGGVERHLLHWAMETRVQGAAAFPVDLAALEQQMQIVRETAVALRQCLPADPGRQRPFNDERRLIFLADIFEEAGGKAVAYASEYAEAGSMAATPFRNFAQQFYSLLPADDKRDRGGLDDALRDALASRRAQRTAKS